MHQAIRIRDESLGDDGPLIQRLLQDVNFILDDAEASLPKVINFNGLNRVNLSHYMFLNLKGYHCTCGGQQNRGCPDRGSGEILQKHFHLGVCGDATLGCTGGVGDLLRVLDSQQRSSETQTSSLLARLSTFLLLFLLLRERERGCVHVYVHVLLVWTKKQIILNYYLFTLLFYLFILYGARYSYSFSLLLLSLFPFI